MAEPAVRVVGLGKRYRVGRREGYRLLSDTVGDLVRRRGREETDRGHIWALHDATFEVGRGEVMGVIGPNGAGKSTLLKILSRITEPTVGYAELRGRIGALLEVGTGFHLELTGRENAFLNGAILGMRRREIEQKLDEIVEFAGVEGFMDTPLKFFSSGMTIRLGFAVAAFFDPEILVVDEVLAVGDIAFQERCLGKMRDVASGGRTVLFVSHNMSAVLALCEKSILLNRGGVEFIGPTPEAVGRYVEASRLRGGDWLNDGRLRDGSGALRVTSIRLEDERGELCPAPEPGQHVRFALDYEAEPDVDLSDLAVRVVVSEVGGRGLLSLMSEVAPGDLAAAPPTGTIVCDVPRIPLMPGHYNVKYSVLIGSELVDKIHQAGTLIISEGDFFGTGRLPPQVETFGPVLVDQRWSVASTVAPLRTS